MEKNSFDKIKEYFVDVNAEQSKETKEGETKGNKKPNKSEYTHFISIPLNRSDIQLKFADYAVKYFPIALI